MRELILHRNMYFSDEDKKSCLPLINKIIELGNIARMKGVLVLQLEIEQEQSLFLKTAGNLIINGTDPQIVKEILQNLILSENHTGAQLLERLIIAEGILGVQSGENPDILAMRLASMLGEKYLTEVDAFPHQEKQSENYQFLNTLSNKETWPESAAFEETLLRCSGRDIQVILKNIQYQNLINALCGCRLRLIYMILDNVSQNKFMQICDDLRIITPSKEYILQSQNEILQTIKSLVNSGEIILWREDFYGNTANYS